MPGSDKTRVLGPAKNFHNRAEKTGSESLCDPLHMNAVLSFFFISFGEITDNAIHSHMGKSRTLEVKTFSEVRG